MRVWLAVAATVVGMPAVVPASTAAADTSTGAGTGSAVTSFVTWQVTRSPFRLTFQHAGSTVAQQAPGEVAGPGGRLAYQAGGSASTQDGARYHRVTHLTGQYAVAHGSAYEVATDEPGRTATVTVLHAAQGAEVRWTFASSDPAAPPVTVVLESLSAGGTEHYLSGSSAAYVDQRGHIRGWSPGKEGHEAGAYCQNSEQAASTFFLSSGGYGFNARTDHVGRFAFPGSAPVADDPGCDTPGVPKGAQTPYPCPVSATPYADRVQICVKDDHLTYDVYPGSPAQVTSRYYATVGLPSLPPTGQFALMKWRDVNTDQAQVLADVGEFKRLGLPLGTIWIDNPWEQQPPGNTVRANGSACNGSLRFDPTFFPDPKAMIDSVHAQGVKFGLWVSPITSTPSAAKGGGSCAGLNDVWAANGWMIPGTNYIDLTIPQARRYYVDRLTELFRLGVDMTKEDRGEEFRLETATLHGGPGSSQYLTYPDRYESAVSEALRTVNGENFQTLVRAAAPGTAQHTHGVWGSDAFATFAGLRAEVRYGISESLTGHFAWGCDIGGIDPMKPADATNSPTPALITRWAQFGAVSPVMEIGGAGLNATPWAYPAATVDRIRAAATLHYELFPYLYGLAEQASKTGVPILRSVGFSYPRDQLAWAQDQEFMVGPDLLAAPVTADRADADGERGQPTPVPVYLPAGRWVDLYSGEVIEGGRTITRDTSLDDFPLYLRAGAALGFNARAGVWGGKDGWDTNDLGKDGLSGWAYAPGAGVSTAITSGRERLTAATHGDVVNLELSGAAGHEQVLLITRDRPAQVTVDGRRLAHLESADALRDAPEGWTVRSGPFGGVVLKIAAPAHVIRVRTVPG
jgi:alpha-D-xyloside xylohydrolase